MVTTTALVERRSFGPSRHGPGCGCRRCRPGVHGAYDEGRVRPLANREQRRLLRRMRLRAGDLDACGRAYLELFCRTTAKIGLIDDWLAVNGLLLDDGRPQPCMGLYVQLTRTATHTLSKLEDHLRADGDRDPADVLAQIRAGT